ncbi:MAG: hypothetical protein HY401_09770 [Elusimicrobia bacterium]|nr:hypothetical protein [Elusimicrobiota bacterium]
MKMVFLLGSIMPFSLAQAGKPWPRLVDVVVRSSVTATVAGEYVYIYTLNNSPKNEMFLYTFEVDLRKNPQSHPLSREDVGIEHDIQAHSLAITGSDQIRSVQIFSPLAWQSGGQYAAWSSRHIGERANWLQPGDNISGFGLRTKEPPGIRRFRTGGMNWDFYSLPEQFDLPKGKKDFDLEVDRGIEFLGQTLAPVSPPDPFTSSTWTARMLSDATEAHKLGWIKSDQQLEKIKKLISDLNTQDKKKLKKSVEGIEKYVLKEKKKGNLTDEADALVRLNALYLLDRLEEKNKKEKK